MSEYTAEKDAWPKRLWRWFTTPPARHICTSACNPWDAAHYTPDREMRP